MKPTSLPSLASAVICILLQASGPLSADTPPTGPAAEKRFPPLKLPPGFKATLYACDPFIEYPSVIALGPKPGSLFVAIDYMTGLGTTIVRRDEIRLLEDTHGDGYADKSIVYASGFNSIQGLAYHDGAVFVMHAPFLTKLRDTDGDGKADERKELLEGLGLPPEKNPVRLHCANGVVGGHDGWLYLALGDHGVDVKRPEGDRLVLKGGGILRCRPDGRDLHVFATGLRNIYDVALDDELNVFVRDNENDGGDYKIRVCHSFFGADHGYPYLYAERPKEALAPLADLGLGSSAGGVSYQEVQFPKEFHGNLFFCEWGRSVVRYVPQRSGSGFGPVKEIEFAAGAQGDPYGFKPTDLVVGYDGSLFVSDWADGQQPKRGRGRIYQIRYGDGPRNATRSAPDERASRQPIVQEWVALLDSPSYHVRRQAQADLEQHRTAGMSVAVEAWTRRRLGVRGRLHAVWVLAHIKGQSALAKLFEIAESDPEPRVQAQAVRAIADLVDPVLGSHRLDAGVGESSWAARLATLAAGRDPRVQLEIVNALGRLRWHGAPAWARSAIPQPDSALAHAVQQMLRRSGNWPEVVGLLDELHGAPIRSIAARALAEQAVPEVATELIARLGAEGSATQREQYADALTRVHRLPGPQPYWGYRPAPRPPNTRTWIGTAAIEDALDRVLTDPDREVRVAVLRRMQREQVPVRSATLQAWLGEEREPERVAAILESLRQHLAADVRDALEKFLLDRTRAVTQRRSALAAWASGLDAATEPRLLAVASGLEDGAVLADLLRATIKRPGVRTEPMLATKARSADADVRAAAADAFAERPGDEAKALVPVLLTDVDARVRHSAATAAGRLALAATAETLLHLARDADPAVRRAALEALRRLGEPRALPLAVGALEDRTTELMALACVGQLGGPAQAAAVLKLARHNPAGDVLVGSVRALTAWAERDGLSTGERRELRNALAELQGIHGVFLHWNTLGPVRADAVPALVQTVTVDAAPSGWRTVLASGTESNIRLGTATEADKDAAWLGLTECFVAADTAVQFQAVCTGKLRVWLNADPLESPADSRRFAAQLKKGMNRLLVQVSGVSGPVNFQLSYRRRSAAAEHERLAQAALTRSGNAERGRKVFASVEKSLCLKCHRLGDQGEHIGPELTGLGSRFSRIHIIESILEPNRAVAPAFQTLRIVLQNGRTLAGLKIAETEKTLTLADQNGDKHVLAKAEIDEQAPIPLSAMPEGLEKRLSEQEFVDLIAFLARQREVAGPRR